MMIYYNHGLAILIFLWALFFSNFNADITTTTSITTTNEDPINVSIESISPSTATSNQISTENPQDVTEITSENVDSTEESNLDTTKTATLSQTSTENPQDVIEMPSENVDSTEESNLDTMNTTTSNQISTENPQDVTKITSENVESTEASNLDTTKTTTSSQTSIGNPQDVTEITSENVESTEASNLDTTKTATLSQTSTGNPKDITEITSENVDSTEANNLNTTKKANDFGATEKLSKTSKTSAPVTTTEASKTNEIMLNSVTKKVSETGTKKSTTPKSKPTTEASSEPGDGSGSGSGDSEGSGSGSGDSGSETTEKLSNSSKTSAPVATTEASKTNETTLNSVTKKMGETSTKKSTTPKSKPTTEASSGSGDGSGSGSGDSEGSGSGSSDSGTSDSEGGNSASTTSTAATTTSDNGAGKRMAFGALMVISLFFMILQIWSSIFGHRMQLHPVRWHTLHYNCWDIFQLVVFADTDTYSPYAGFLHNSNIDTGLNNLQKLTFTAFMSSWIVVTPFILISYYLPNILKNRFTQWIIWIPIYTILNIIPIAFCFAGNFMDPTNDIFNAYHMGITGLFLIFLLVSIVFTIVSLVVFIVHSIMYCINIRKHSTKFLPHAYDFLHLLFKLIYYIVSFYTIMPYNSKTMVEYLTRVIGMMTLMNWMNWALQNLANIMPTLMDIFQSLLNQAAWCALMIPIGEFFTTFIWIEMYREQYIWLLSCGRFYKDKIGKNITKQPMRATTMVVQPRQTGLAAKPGAVAPRNGGWTDPVLQGALNTDPNARFIPVSNTAPLQQNCTSNGQDSRKGNNSFSSTASLISSNSTKKID